VPRPQEVYALEEMLDKARAVPAGVG
jgi:hypothetical protein